MIIDADGRVELGDEAIHPDQIIPATLVTNRIMILYPRGSKTTILGWICEIDNPYYVAKPLSEENGFFHWIQDANGDLINPTDRKEGPATKIVGFKL